MGYSSEGYADGECHGGDPEGGASGGMGLLTGGNEAAGQSSSAALIEQALAQLKARAPYIRQCQDYYDGRHRICYASEQWHGLFGRLFHHFADNLCPAVVTALADRLDVVGFQLEDQDTLPRLDPADLEAALGGGDDAGPHDADPAAAKKFASLAWDVWTDNRFGWKAARVHRQALTVGDAYVLVWPSRVTSRPVLYPQRSDQCTVSYDEEEPGTLRWAAKGWVNARRKFRLNLYLPDRIEKWVTQDTVHAEGLSSLTLLPEKATAFTRYQDLEDSGWPLSHELGQVPMFHFANDADPGDLGRCEFEIGIPLQDALNKAVVDMLVAGEFASFPQRWATGIETPSEDAGDLPAKFIAGLDRLWTSEDTETKFGQFLAADLAKHIQVQDSLRLELARVTGTPLHYIAMLQGVPPSAAALRTLEQRLTKKARERMGAFGDVWDRVLGLAMLILKQRGVSIATQWRSPEVTGDKEMIDGQFVKGQLGVPKRQLLLELDYSEAQVEQFLMEWQQERDEEAQRQLDQQAQVAAIARPTAAAGGPRQPNSVTPRQPITPNGGRRGDQGKPRSGK